MDLLSRMQWRGGNLVKFSKRLHAWTVCLKQLLTSWSLTAIHSLPCVFISTSNTRTRVSLWQTVRANCQSFIGMVFLVGGTSREQHLAHDVSLMFLSQRLEELKKLSPLCSCFEKMSESFSEPCYLRREEDSQISRTQSDLIISPSGGLLFPSGPSGPAVLYHHYRRTCDVRGISLSVSACVCVCCCLHPHCHEDILQRV